MRDLQRKPFDALLTGLCLATVIVAAAVGPLFSQAFSNTVERVLVDAPSLVVRKVSPGGWQPIEAAEASKLALGVPGVVEARARLWGNAAGPDGPVTLFAADASAREEFAALGYDLPSQGEALVGPAFADFRPGDGLTLVSATTKILQVKGILSADHALSGHDLVLAHPADVRAILGVPEGMASDLAVWVFHDGEAEAMRADLAQAFPWPVRVTTKADTLGRYASVLERRDGFHAWMLLPVVLALALLSIGTMRDQLRRRSEIGLLKALGWSGGDVLRLHLAKSLLILLPSCSIGAIMAYVLVFYPGIEWPGTWWFGWTSRPPALSLDSQGAWLVLLEVAAFVALPWLTAALLPGLWASTVDAEELLHDSR